MKEARIILPDMNAEQQAALYEVQKHIVAAFGGCTVTSGYGYWVDPKTTLNIGEVVKLVDVAYIPSIEADNKLYDIANAFRIDCKQEAVYLRYGNGNVQLVTADSTMDNGQNQFAASFSGVLEAINQLIDEGLPTEQREAAFEFLESSLVHRLKKAA